MKHFIKIKNVSKGEELLKIRDDNGNLRNAEFSSLKAAKEAIYIIEKFRSDAAFQYARAVPYGG